MEVGVWNWEVHPKSTLPAAGSNKVYLALKRLRDIRIRSIPIFLMVEFITTAEFDIDWYLES